MDRLIATNSVPYASRDIAPASGTPQYATSGNPATSTPATIWPAYAWNMIQDEILAVISAAGITPDDTNWAQLLAAISLIGRRMSVFTASGTFVVPAGVTRVKCRLWGGGGGGGGSAGYSSGGSGGGGAGFAENMLGVTPGASITVTVGAGGTGGTNAPTNGGSGGTTSFGSLLSATGGGGGSPGNGVGTTVSGLQGSGVGGALNVTGSYGSLPTIRSSSVVAVGQGGASFGTPANLQSDASALSIGQPGLVPGGGGCGGALAGYGGTGAGGLVIVEY